MISIIIFTILSLIIFVITFFKLIKKNNWYRRKAKYESDFLNCRIILLFIMEEKREINYEKDKCWKRDKIYI